jgi:hypothetical protein
VAVSFRRQLEAAAGHFALSVVCQSGPVVQRRQAQKCSIGHHATAGCCIVAMHFGSLRPPALWASGSQPCGWRRSRVVRQLSVVGICLPVARCATVSRVIVVARYRCAVGPAVPRGATERDALACDRYAGLAQVVVSPQASVHLARPREQCTDAHVDLGVPAGMYRQPTPRTADPARSRSRATALTLFPSSTTRASRLACEIVAGAGAAGSRGQSGHRSHLRRCVHAIGSNLEAARYGTGAPFLVRRAARRPSARNRRRCTPP